MGDVGYEQAGNWSCERGLFELELRGVEQHLIPMSDKCNFPIFLLRNGSLTLMYMAHLMVLVISGDSLPTMEKLSVIQNLKGVYSDYS